MTMEKKREKPSHIQQIAAQRVTMTTFLLMLALTTFTIFFVPNGDKTPLDNYMMPLVALSAGFSYILARRGRHIPGIYILLGCIALVSLAYPLAIKNIGWQTAFGMLLITTGVATNTLPQRTSGRISVAAFLFTFVIILIEIFAPGMDEVPITTSSIIVTVVLGVIYLGFIFYRFSQFELRTKLIIFFVAISIFSVGSVAAVTNILTRDEITQQVGRNQQTLADRLAFETGTELESQIENLQAVASQLETSAEDASNSYTGTEDEILIRILALDQEWRTGPDQGALILKVLNNAIADDLREFQRRFPNHTDIFLTDRYGANIAATDQIPDYYHGGEDWWRTAYNQGRGRVYISQPEFNQTSQSFGILMAVPIISNGNVVGVLRTTYSVSTILENLQTSETSGVFDIDLRISFNSYINGDAIDPEEIPGLNSVSGKYGEIIYKGEPSLVSQYRVFSSADSLAQNSVSLLNWNIIVKQDLDDALQPVQQQTRTITVLAMVIMLLAGLGGYAASIRLAEPIITLTGIAGKIAEGDLSIQARVQSQDEIGELANSFNRMTGQLRDTLSGLERRVAERTADLDTARLISERRAQELQSISEISRTISTEQRLDILLPLVTRLVSERFDYYHAGIFFVDDSRQFATLQAANSDGGRQMLARGHRLDIGKGLVGTVAQSGKPRIALDVGSDAIFFDNPDLP
ncbi:MAG TPA: hypothetical protein DCX53_06115, partial [Anaerolineae bacterium]|nr:hypothetical protein [Anaerolineae bacterium]